MNMAIKKFLPVWSLSLGCPKNRVDTEKLLGSLGMPVKTCAHPGKSRLALINTCAFIEPATRESIRAILDAAAKCAKLKTRPLLVVAGCLPGRHGIEELKKEIPEVDLWLEPAQIENWPKQILAALGMDLQAGEGRLLSTAPAYAWLKISDGCNHHCSFCAIPSIRGNLRSRPATDILSEAHALLEEGVSELVLVGQDVCAWGRDFKENRESLVDLLPQLASLPALKWLRLLYLYPNSLDDGLLQTMADCAPKLLPYLDIPFQHCEKEILQKMGRPFAVNPLAIVDRVRKFLPKAALRTTLIVGFPGETEKQFLNLLDFVKTVRFHNLGVFAYQAEEGTPAADLPDQLPLEEKEERREELMRLQAQISTEILASYVGSRLDVLVDASLENEWPGLCKGRVWFQAPEVDGITYVSGPGITPGAFRECDIEESATYDLTALA